jgi:hypothetical protein
MGETAALSLSKGMRRGQDSPVNKSLKKPAREPWNERKDFIACAYFNNRIALFTAYPPLENLLGYETVRGAPD